MTPQAFSSQFKLIFKMSDKLSLPENFDQKLDFYTSGGALGSVNVKAAASSFGENGIQLRDNTDVAFTVNYFEVPELQEWAGIAGQFRVKWLETNNENRLWVYGLQKIGKQAVLLCSYAGSSSLTPPPSEQDLSVYGGITRYDWPHRVPSGGTNFLGTNAYLPSVLKNFLGMAQIGGLDFFYFESNTPGQDRFFPSAETRNDVRYEVCYLRIPKGAKDVTYNGGNPWDESFNFEEDFVHSGPETTQTLQGPFLNAVHSIGILPSQGEKAFTRRALSRPVPFIYQEGDKALIKLLYHEDGFTFPGGGGTVYHWMMPFRTAAQEIIIIDDNVGYRSVVSGGTTGIIIIDDNVGYMPSIFNGIASCDIEAKWYLNLNGNMRYITSSTDTEDLGFFAIRASDVSIAYFEEPE